MLVAVLAAGVLHGRATGPSPLPGARAGIESVAPVIGGRQRAVASSAAAAGGVKRRAAPGWRERTRARLQDRIERTFPAEHGMVAALLLADRSGVEREVRDAFRNSGTSHLLAISGFHVGVLAGWLVLLLRLPGLSRRGALASASGVIWAYVAVLGFPGSAVRAATIFTLVTAGRVLGRPVVGLGGWGAALLLIAVATPDSVRSVGTQLSFLGSLGLILWADRWRERMDGAVSRAALRRGLHLGTERREAVAGAIAASAAAQWATLPLAAWTFQQVPLAGLPATLIATPLVAFALPGALVALLFGSVHPLLGALPGAGVEALLAGLREVIALAGRIGPVVRVGPATVGAAAVGVLVVAGGWRRWRPGVRVPLLLGPGAALVVALLTAPVGGWLASATGLRGVEFHFMDVGQGDAIAIRSPRGRWVLVDTGPPSGERLVGELLKLGVARLDLLVLTHPDLDHIGGAAAVVRAFPVGGILDPVSVRGGAWRTLLEVASRREVRWSQGRAGQRFEIDGLRFEVLSPGDSVDGAGSGAPVNDRSLVLRVSWGDFDALLTGDVPVRVEEAMAGVAGDVELLKVAHHGSATSTSPALLRATRPELAVIQVGRRNRFGHPVPAVVRRLEESGARVLRTDRDGRVSVRILRRGAGDRPWRIRVDPPDLD